MRFSEHARRMSPPVLHTRDLLPVYPVHVLPRTSRETVSLPEQTVHQTLTTRANALPTHAPHSKAAAKLTIVQTDALTRCTSSEQKQLATRLSTSRFLHTRAPRLHADADAQAVRAQIQRNLADELKQRACEMSRSRSGACNC
eukprot:2657623-Pleurochrysis_carterae.AAC.1